LAVALGAIAVGSIVQPARAADELRYRLRVGEEIAYTFTLGAKSGTWSGSWSGSNRLRVDPLPSLPGSETAEPDKATGSGFFVTDDGYLLTCAHVVKGATKIEVAVGDKKYDGRVISQDKIHDLALLRIEGTGFSPLPLADSGAVELGQEVRAVGFPFSDVLGETIKIVRGTVAGLVDLPDGKLLQVDAGINPGNSGGPMVNEQGQVVGVVSAKMSSYYKASNVGFCQPINEAKSLLAARKISFQSAGADQKLEGPALAKRVIPSVVLITVTLRPSLDNIRLLAYRAIATQQGQGTSGQRAGAVDDGHVVINGYGDVLVADFDRALPACLGPVGQIGIEQFSDEGRKKWTSERIVQISQSTTNSTPGSAVNGTATTTPSDATPFGRSRSRLHPGRRSRGGTSAPPPKKETVVIQPALDRTQYEITSATSDVVEIKKTTELTSLAKPGTAGYLSLAGKSTLRVDPRSGVPESLEFEGTLTTQDGPIELKYAYRRVDPASADNTGPPPLKTVAAAKSNSATAANRAAGDQALPGQTQTWRGQRPAAPAGEQLAKAVKLVNEMFESELSAAKAVGEKSGVAKILVEHARRQKPGGLDRYAALEKARDLAAAGGDPRFSNQIIAEMAAGYRADVAALRYSSLQLLSESVSGADGQQQVGEAALAAIDDAIRSDRFEVARALGKLAVAAARKAKDEKLVERVKQGSAELLAAQQAFAEYQTAETALKDDPKKAAANTIAGRYDCLVRNEWETGLPRLALADDTQLRELAEKELSGPADSEAQFDLANSWWDLGEHESHLRKANLQSHARKWYALVIDDLTGEAKIKAELRLAGATTSGQ
jgi:S1-C subfamily serine protease